MSEDFKDLIQYILCACALIASALVVVLVLL